MPKNRGSQTLNFKVGLGRVIRGWDEAILKMCVGETAGITIDPEWAYGKKGNLPTIQPNTTLYYQCTLETIG
jgi:FK506-binding protein 3